jgi:ribosomal protein S18 acetylase RimI-like enzyme
MNPNLQARLHAHAIEAHIILAENSQEGEVERSGDYVLGYTGVALPSFNFFLPLTLTGLTDDTLADASAFFRTRDTLYAVSLEEHRVPDGTEYLSKRRYQPLPPEPIMALESLPKTRFAQDKLEVEVAATVPALTALYSVLEAVFDYTPDEAMLLFPTRQLSAENLKHFIGFRSDGTPVTVGTAVYAEGVVSVWHLSTLDDHRRQDYASILLNHILVSAVERGCDASLIYDTPMGFSLFNKFGYKLYAMRQWFLPQELA